jgi:hypothetical protein
MVKVKQKSADNGDSISNKTNGNKKWREEFMPPSQPKKS